MAVTYKDIDLLTQKSSVVGNEKLPVSDTEHISPYQIATLLFVDVEEDGLYIADENLCIGVVLYGE